jgi:hypothetical protein
MMKLRIATGLGLVLFMATVVGGLVRASHAKDDGGVTLASLAGKFAGRASGFETLCFNATFRALAACASVPPAQRVPYNAAEIFHSTHDAAGNACAVETLTGRRAFGAGLPTSAETFIGVSTLISFDPTTGAGTASFKTYHGGSCIGPAFGGTGTLTATGTVSFDVSDSGNRIEHIITGFTAVASAFSVAGSVNGLVFGGTSIRLHSRD